MLGKTGGRKRPKRWTISVSPWLVFAIVAAVLTYYVVIPVYRSLQPSPDTGAVIPKIATGDLYIDISHHNAGTIVWDSLMVMTDAKGRTTQDINAAKDIRPLAGVIFKASEGVGMRDQAFRKRWKESARRGLVRGAYHFFRSSKDGKQQAKSFISTVGNIPHNDLAPIVDVETIHKGCTEKELNTRLRECLQALEKHYHRKPIVYTYDSFAKDYLDKSILDEYPVWIAHYKTEKPDYQNWMMWQFAEDAVVYGVPGKVDLSVMK